MADEVKEPEVKCRTALEYILWKLDRNLAIAGIIAIGICSLFRVLPQDSQQLASAAITGLSTYAGIRSGK